MDLPEQHQHPHANTGHRWVDLMVAAAALIMSGASIAIALHHGETMEKMVAADSWPFPTYDSSNFTDNEHAVELSIKNSGLGPAKLESVVIRYGDTIVRDWAELLRACCSTYGSQATVKQLLDETGGAVVSSGPSGRVLLPAESVRMLRLVKTDGNKAIWSKLDTERFKLTIDACYCSVFDDCWRSNLRTTKPNHVEQCSPSKDSYQG